MAQDGSPTSAPALSAALATRPRQLTLDGAEVELTRRRHRALSPSVKRVLDLLEHEGELRSVEAGVALHKLEGCVQEGARWLGWTGGRSKGCCPYASASGYRALRRLESLGLAKHEAGRWQAVQRVEAGR